MSNRLSVIPWSIILDPQRLSDLRSLNIIDTQPEQSYNDLAAIARLICGTSVANVCFVSENRQWFKAYVGSDVQETPVDLAVCAHALDKSDILVINDLTTDARTRDNILVTGEQSLRFYAGVPLRLGASSNLGVGTLCVLDTKPHPEGLNPVQIEALAALGRQATILLQVRRFLASKDQDLDAGVTLDKPLEDITDALLAAYDSNKIYKDKTLDSLITSCLTHIAVRIAREGKSDILPVH